MPPGTPITLDNLLSLFGARVVAFHDFQMVGFSMSDLSFPVCSISDAPMFHLETPRIKNPIHKQL